MYKGQIENVAAEKAAKKQSNEKTAVREKKNQTCANNCS